MIRLRFYMPILKRNVAQLQLMFDVHLLKVMLVFITLQAADQTETIKFVPESEVLTLMSKLITRLLALQPTVSN